MRDSATHRVSYSCCAGLTCALLQAAAQVDEGAAHPGGVHPVADQDICRLQVKETAIAIVQCLHSLHVAADICRRM